MTNITIKLSKEQITINLREDAEYTDILEELKEKIIELKNLYKDEKTPILITGKLLTEEQTKEIQQIITSQIKVEIQMENNQELGLSAIKTVFSKTIENSQTKFYKGSLRSGQKLQYEGSIVVTGDVNGGAEIVAGENIIIMGALRGLAHAGANGNKKAIIATNKLETPQIRISNIVKEMQKEETYVNTYIYVNEENQIIIEK